MNLPAELLPQSWLWTAHVLYALVMVWVFLYAPWGRLREENFDNVFLGGVVSLMVLWSVDAGAQPGLNYHFLGAMLFTLMFDWAFAIIGMSLVLAGNIFYGMGDWSGLSLNALLLAVLPVFVSQRIRRLIERWLPDHFFIYVYGNGFFGAALVTAVTVVASTAVLVFAGAYAAHEILDQFLVYTPLMMFAEAFMTGMLTTLLVVFRPAWIRTFDDERYLRGK